MRFTFPLVAATTLFAATPVFAQDCTAEIKSVMDAAMTSGPLYMESTITAPELAMTLSGNIVPPKDMHVTVDTNGEAVEMIVLGEKAWMNMGGTWTELPAEAAGEISKSFDLADTSALDAMTDAQCNGTVNVEGEDYLSYGWNLSVEGSDTVNAILVDPEDMVPVHMETTVNTQGVETSVVVDYTYDETLTVDAPTN